MEIDCHQKRLSVDGQPVKIRAKALALLHYLLDCQKSGNLPDAQKDAAVEMTDWLKTAHSIPAGLKPPRMVDADVRHELNFLRASLQKPGYEIPLRSLRLPASKLSLGP